MSRRGERQPKAEAYVTRYSVDVDRKLLLASWPTGHGDTAEVICDIPGALGERDAFRLAEALTIMSDALWDRYARPASAVFSSAEDDRSEAFYRQRDRENFPFVQAVIADPDAEGLPGSPHIGPLPVQEGARSLGRVLRGLAEDGLAGDAAPAVAKLAADEVARELAAVEQAERGEYRPGTRARQALVLSRAETIPTQVAAADAILRQDPLHAVDPLRDVDPASAAVAAAHWLVASAVIAGEVSGVEAEHVPLRAFEVKPFTYQVPLLALAAAVNGEDENPLTTFVTLAIGGALRVAEGRYPSIDAIRGAPGVLAKIGTVIDVDDPVNAEMALSMLRVAQLDPRRPAPDLLDNLLQGIGGSWYLYREHAKSPDEAVFTAAVRAEAAAHQHTIF
jgi:hypothetical protein